MYLYMCACICVYTNILQVKFKDMLKLNAPDWHLVTTGVIMSGLFGCMFPIISVLFAEMLEVSCVTVCVCVCVCERERETWKYPKSTDLWS